MGLWEHTASSLRHPIVITTVASHSQTIPMAWCASEKTRLRLALLINPIGIHGVKSHSPFFSCSVLPLEFSLSFISFRLTCFPPHNKKIILKYYAFCKNI